MPQRSYRQYCAIARALDVVGDRWTMLIVRNLLLGPQSWTELRDGLPGVAKNLLAERLKSLASDGLVEHDGDRYGLTVRGRELEPILFALADWGERHFLGPPHAEDAVRLRYLMTSVRRKLDTDDGSPVVLQIVVDDAAFWVRLGSEATVEQGVSAEPSATVHCTVPGIRALVFGGPALEQLEADQLLTIKGDQRVVERFRSAIR